MINPMYSLSVGTYVPMLETLSTLLDKAAAQCENDTAALFDARLAPDMFTLAQQVRQACYYAANDASRLAGRAARQVPTTASSLDALKREIRATIEFVSAIPVADFAQADARDCSIEIPNDMIIKMDGSRFLRSWSLPHFYFHLVTAYDILRHNGIDIGKRDFLSLADAVRPRVS